MMQRLWSRSAQTRSCQCGPCVHTATRVARNTSTAVGRRRVKAGDVFTASFTGLFATAAVIDAKKKDERVREWDRAIEEVKAGKDLASIKTPDMVSIGKAASPGNNIMGSDTRNSLKIQGTHKDASPSARNVISKAPESMTVSEAFRRSKPVKAKDAWKELEAVLARYTSGEFDLAVKDAVDVSIFQEREKDCDVGSGHRDINIEPWEPRSLYDTNQVSEMVAKLVNSLLDIVATEPTKPSSGRRRPKTSRTEQARKLAQESLSNLQNLNPNPSYQVSDTHLLSRERKELNTSIAHLMRDGLHRSTGLESGRSLDNMVACICYNLLVSQATPDINTFNIMISRFNRLREHKLAGAVIEALQNSPLRANEATVSAVLQHYRLLNYRRGYKKALNRYAGYEGGFGFKEMPLPKSACKATASRWVEANGLTLKKGVLRMQPAKNGLLFEEMIRGAMHFDSIGLAIGLVRQAMDKGQRIRKKLFHELVAAIDKSNVSNVVKEGCSTTVINTDRRQRHSLMLLGALVRQFAAGQDRLKNFLQYDFMVRELIYKIIDYCGLQPSVESLRNFKLKHLLPCDIGNDRFVSMLNHLQLEETKDQMIGLFQRAKIVELKAVQMSSPTPSQAYARKVRKSFLKLADGLVHGLHAASDLSLKYRTAIRKIDAETILNLNDDQLKIIGIDSSGLRERLLRMLDLTKLSVQSQFALSPPPNASLELAASRLSIPSENLHDIRIDIVGSILAQLPESLRAEYKAGAKAMRGRDRLVLLVDMYHQAARDGTLLKHFPGEVKEILELSEKQPQQTLKLPASHVAVTAPIEGNSISALLASNVKPAEGKAAVLSNLLVGYGSCHKFAYDHYMGQDSRQRVLRMTLKQPADNERHVQDWIRRA